MTKKINELTIVSSIVFAFFVLLSVSYILAEGFNELTGGRAFLVFYRDSDLAFYTFWAVLLIPIVFFIGSLRPIEYSVGIKGMPLGGLSLGFLFLRTKWLLPCILIHYFGNLSHFYFPYFRTLF